MNKTESNFLKVILLGIAVITFISPAFASRVSTGIDNYGAKERMVKSDENQRYINELAAELDAAGISYDFSLNEHMELLRLDDGSLLLTGMPEDEDVFYEFQEHKVGGRVRRLIVPMSKDDLEDNNERLRNILAKNSSKRAGSSNISGSSVVENYGFTHGSEVGDFKESRNTFYMYVKKGETVRVMMSDFNRSIKSDSNQSAYLVNQNGEIVDSKIMRHQNKGLIEESGYVEYVSDEDQVFAFFTDDESNDSFSYRLDIQIGMDGQSHQKGRVFSKNWSYYQNQAAPKDDPRTLIGYSTTLYHVTPMGAIYRQTFKDHNGIHFDIESNAVGIVENGDESCQPVYSSTPYHQYTDKYDVITRNKHCGSIIESNNIFLEYPADDLPEAAILPGGKQDFIYPNIEKFTPSIDSVLYNKTNPLKHGGDIVFATSGHMGSLNLMIMADDKGDGNYKTVRAMSPSVAPNERTVIKWDGKDEEGKDVDVKSNVKVKLAIEKPAEIHFVVRDLEMNRGGMQVTALKNFSGVESNILHYDDSNPDIYPIDWDNTNPRFKGGFSQLEGYDSVENWDYHAWDYLKGNGTSAQDSTRAPKLDDYPGKIGDPSRQIDSLGDGNYMHEWTWDKHYSAVEEETKTGEIDLIYGSLVVKDANDNNYAETDETLSYSGSFYNFGAADKLNPTIRVDVSDWKFDRETIDNVYVTINGKDIKVDHKVEGRSTLVIETEHNFTYNDEIEYGFTIKPDGIMKNNLGPIETQASIADGQGLTTPDIVDGYPATVYGEPSKKTIIDPAGPVLTIDKEGYLGSSSSVGEYITYYITIENVSDFVAKEVIVEDPLNHPALKGAEIRDISIEGDVKPNIYVDDKIKAVIRDFEAGERFTLKFVAVLEKAPKGGEVIDNTAYVMYNEEEDSAEHQVEIEVNEPTIRKRMIDIGDENGYISPGERIRFVFDIEAGGGRDLKDLRITDKLEDVKFKDIKDLKVIEEESAPIKENYSTDKMIDVLFEPISGGERTQLVVEAQMSKGMVIDGKNLVNKAKYTSSNGPDGEVEAELPVAKPEIKLIKGVEAGDILNKYQTIYPSKEFKYVISVENTSQAMIFDLEVKDIFKNDFFKKNIDVLDAKIENKSAGVLVSDYKDGKVLVEKMPAQGKFDIVLNAKMRDLSEISLKDQEGKELNPEDEFLVRNTAKAETPDYNGTKHIDVVSEDKEGHPETTVEVIFPFLKQTKKVEALEGNIDAFGPGDRFKWTIETKNIGKQAMKEAVIEEISQDFFKYVDIEKILVDGKEVSKSSKSYTIPMIAANESKSVVIEGAIKDVAIDELPDELVNIAKVSFADIDRESNAKIKKGSPDLSIEKTTDKKYVAAADEIKYQIKVRNEGDITLKNVLIEDNMSHPQIKKPESIIKAATKERGGKEKVLDATSFMRDGYKFNELKPNEEVVFELEFKLPGNLSLEAIDSLDNQAIAKADKIERESKVSTPVKESGVYAEKTVSDNVDKNKNIDGYAEAGEYLKYEIEVFNDSDIVAKGVRVKDPLDDKHLKGGELFDENFNKIEKAEFNLSDIAAGGSQKVVFYVRLNKLLPEANDVIVNQAIVELENGKSTKTNKASIELIKPELELIKSVTASHPDNEVDMNVAISNRIIRYTFQVSNDSIVRVNNPILRDAMDDENLLDAEILRVFIAGGEDLEGDIRQGIKLPDLEPYSQLTVYMDVKLSDINKGGASQDEIAEFIENQAELKSDNAEPVESEDEFGNKITKLPIGRYDVEGITTVSDDLEGNIVNDLVSPNDLIEHTVSFENKSNVPLENVFIKDIFIDDKFEQFELENAYAYIVDEKGELVLEFEMSEGNRMFEELDVGLIRPGHKVVIKTYHRAPEDLRVFEDYQDDILRLSARLTADNIEDILSRDIGGGPESIIGFEEPKYEPEVKEVDETKPSKPDKVETYAKGLVYIYTISIIVSITSFTMYRKRKKRV